MRYLARALAQGPAAARPAMRTSSPLAEADQRLHLDAFAGRFDAPVGRRAAAEELAPDPFEAEASDATQDPSFPAPDRRARPRGAEALAPGLAPPPSRSSATPPPPAPTSRIVEPPPVVAAPRRPDAAEPASPLRGSPPSPGRAPAPRPSALETRAPIPERSRPHDAVALAPDRPPAPSPTIDSSRPRSLAPMIPPTTLTPDPQVPDAIAQALATVATWLDRPGPVEPSPAVAEASPAREREVPAPVSRREPLRASVEAPMPSRPRLEIGSIEVEVVPPERPRRAPAPARTPAPAAGSMTPVFGWRQR